MMFYERLSRAGLAAGRVVGWGLSGAEPRCALEDGGVLLLGYARAWLVVLSRQYLARVASTLQTPPHTLPAKVGGGCCTNFRCEAHCVVRSEA